MVDHKVRLSDHLLAENDGNGDGEIVLKARNEVGRGKRYGISGEITMDRDEAEAFAKWVFASEIEG